MIPSPSGMQRPTLSISAQSTGDIAEIWSVDSEGAKKQITSGGNDFRPDVAFQKGSLVCYRMRT